MGDAKKKPVFLGDEVFSSRKEFADYLGITATLLSKYLKKGMTAEEIVASGVGKCKYRYNGKSFKARTHLVKELGMSYESVSRYMKLGLSVEEIAERSRRVEYEGVVYADVSKLAVAYGINANTLKTRLRKGMSLEDAISTYVKPRSTVIAYNGVVYKSIASLCKTLNLDAVVVRKRLSLGWDLSYAIECPVAIKVSTKK